MIDTAALQVFGQCGGAKCGARTAREEGLGEESRAALFLLFMTAHGENAKISIFAQNLMNLITETFNLFFKNKRTDHTKTYIFACQHILRPREVMFSLLVEFGIPQENIFILGKAYSTNYKLLKELMENKFNVHQPPFDNHRSFDEQHRENCKQLFNLCIEKVTNKSRVIVLDDGAMLLSLFNNRFEKISKEIDVLGIEQTSSGFRKLENEKLNFPIINVARSVTKLGKESPFIAEICLRKLSEYFFGKEIGYKKYLILGLGPIGKSFIELLQERGENVVGFDIVLGNEKLKEKIKTLKPNIIIGATGTASISKDDVEYLNSLGYPVYLVSASSSDREFPAIAYRKRSEANIHSDIRFNNIVFVNNGFPINFEINRPKEGIRWIERTICLILGSVLHLASIKKPSILKAGFIDVPKNITAIL